MNVILHFNGYTETILAVGCMARITYHVFFIKFLPRITRWRAEQSPACDHRHISKGWVDWGGGGSSFSTSINPIS